MKSKTRHPELKGSKIGNWLVLEQVDDIESETGYHWKAWKCQCQCENKTIEIFTENCLTRGNLRDCGCNQYKGRIHCRTDLTGQKIGMLKVLCQTDDKINSDGKHIAMWTCQCSCENQTIIDVSDAYLKDKKRKTPANCGCLKHHEKIEVREDLTGKVFGMLTVLERAKDKVLKDGRKIPMWKCQCSCKDKTIKDISGNSLRSGKVKSCGCLNRNPENKVRVKEDLTGRKFGRWTVLKQGEDIIVAGRRRAAWVCQCSCKDKTIRTVIGTALKRGESLSCGCINQEITGKITKKRNEIRYLKSNALDEKGNLLYKRCSFCKEWKEPFYFKKAKTRDGISSRCIYCDNYITYIKNAERREIEFHLTREEFISIIQQPCEYCGEYTNNDFGLNGIDRINSSKGYEIDNVVPCCKVCNIMKHNFTLEYWQDKITKIYKHSILKEKGFYAELHVPNE